MRAFARLPFFAARFDEALDTNSRAYYAVFSANCWLAVRLEAAGSLIIASAGVVTVLQRQMLAEADPYAGRHCLSQYF